MAKRKMLFHPDYVWEKIRASQLINRLQNHALGLLKPELTTSQVRAIEILLRKSIPDLAAAKIKSEQTHRYVIEMPPVLDGDEWQRKYGQNPMEIRAEPELATAEPTVIWRPGSNPAQWALQQRPVFAPRAERPATPKQ